MAKQSNDNLLTIGKIFKTDAGEFKILRKLGQGATGEVYQDNHAMASARLPSR